MKEKNVECPYCKKQAKYCSSKEVYNGRDYGMIYLCADCNAYVGVHKGTSKPLGMLANEELRRMKQKAHAAFDPKWKENNKISKSKARNNAYEWLALLLDIPKKECHIGMFDIDLCQRTIDICSND